jgi:hypothetical protein
MLGEGGSSKGEDATGNLQSHFQQAADTEQHPWNHQGLSRARQWARQNEKGLNTCSS